VLTGISKKASPAPFRREPTAAERLYSHDILSVGAVAGAKPSGPQALFGDGDPLRLHLADVFRGPSHLSEDIGIEPLGLGLAAHLCEQRAPADARLGARIVIGQRPVFVECLIGAAAVLERTGIEQMTVGRLIIRPPLPQLIERRDRILRATEAEFRLRLAE